MKRLLTICMMIYATLFADEIVIVDSDLAEYDGENIILSGHVQIRHEMGTIAANHVKLLSTPDLPEFSYGLVQMHENVRINFKDGGQISCSQANLDYRTLQGTFVGSPSQDYVVYTENCRTKDQQRLPLIIKGRKMGVQFLRGESKMLESPKSMVSSMHVEENVTVNYAQDFIAISDSALYQRAMQQAKAAAAEFIGLITLKAAERAGQCHLTNKEGDLVRANRMSIDTQQRHLNFVAVTGHLKEENLEFKANKLLWDEPQQILTLSDEVEVFQPCYGRITTDHELRVMKGVDRQGRRQLKSIECPSDTKITYYDGENQLHTLTCPGRVFVDHLSLTATLDSPITEQNERQVVLVDTKGEIFADQVIVKYGLQDRKVTPQKIYLNGNVKILNHLTTDQGQPVTLMQYALADHVEYNPMTEEMRFSSEGKRRVLFFDKMNNLQVSAPGLKIRRDESTQKDLVQGEGDVRFSFIEKEFERLRQKFAMLEKLGTQG